MIYNIRLFNEGFATMGNVCWEAKSHKQALREYSKQAGWANWSNAIVVSKSGIGKRFNSKYQLIKETPRFFPTIHNKKPCILIMLGSYAEIHIFNTIKARNEELEKCMTSDPVESVESGKEQSDITASSVETSDSESGLTSKKTLNGFAMNATWLDSQIQWSTVLNSSPAKSDDLDVLELLLGSSRSRSKRRPIFATLKKKDGKPGYKTVQVVKSGRWYKSETDAFRAKELDFRYAVLKIKNRIDNDYYPRRMLEKAGKTVKMHQCSDHWNDGRYCWETKCLELPSLVKKGKLIGGEGIKVCITKEDLGNDLGTVMSFKYSPNSGNWKMLEGHGYYVRKEWIDFRYRENENG